MQNKIMTRLERKTSNEQYNLRIIDSNELYNKSIFNKLRIIRQV